jgi:hypothetical protein
MIMVRFMKGYAEKNLNLIDDFIKHKTNPDYH